MPEQGYPFGVNMEAETELGMGTFIVEATAVSCCQIWHLCQVLFFEDSFEAFSRKHQASLFNIRQNSNYCLVTYAKFSLCPALLIFTKKPEGVSVTIIPIP